MKKTKDLKGHEKHIYIYKNYYHIFPAKFRGSDKVSVNLIR